MNGLVRMMGLEPTLPCGNWNLNPEDSVAPSRLRSQDAEIERAQLAPRSAETRLGKDKQKHNLSR
jgi:hypothetical protein